jgi:AraC-like DNA-binding protein
MQKKTPKIILDTSEQSAPERFDNWWHAVSDTFVPLRCERPPDFDPAKFNGRLRSLPLNGLQVIEVSATPHTVRRTPQLVTRSAGEFYKFTLQTSGDSLLEQDGREAPLQRGDLVVYDTTRPYSIRLGHPYQSLVLVIPRQRLAISPDKIGQVTARAISGTEGMGELLAHFLKKFVTNFELLGETCRLLLADNIVGLVHTLLTERIESARGSLGSSREILRLQITKFIEAQLGDPQLDQELIASANNISKSYLQKIFQDEILPVGEYIRRQRLERCRRDLQDPLQTDCQIGTIGARWGFSNSAHFSRVFRDAYGMSPRQFRSTSSEARQSGLCD